MEVFSSSVSVLFSFSAYAALKDVLSESSSVACIVGELLSLSDKINSAC